MSLSPRTFLICSVIIFLAITGIWLGEPLQGLWKLPTVIMFILMIGERWQLNKQFIIKRKIAPIIFLGEKTHYQLSINNPSQRRLLMETQAHYPDSLQADNTLHRWSITAGDKQTNTLNLLPVALGDNTLGSLYTRLLGQFGLVWWTHTLHDTVNFTVEPAILRYDKALSGQIHSGGQKTRSQSNAGFELLALRDYQYGDSQRTIDWKASARRQKPMVRVFSQEQRLDIVVIVDCGRGSYIQCGAMDRLHHYINIAARLTDFAIQHDDSIACIAYADQIIAHIAMSGNIKAVKNIRHLLTKLRIIPNESNPLLVALELKRFLKRRSLVIFLTEIEQAEASTQLIQAMHLLRAKHHLLVASINDPDINALIYHPSQQWLAPYQKLAALEYLRGRELTINKLRKSGVSIITAPADHLDGEVLNYYQRLHHSREL